MANITYRHIDKYYPNGFHAVKALDLEIADGEFMVIVGPSGCGKTTAMRMCAGLEEISGGELLIDDQVVNHLQPQQRNISMVFQNYALYPHMSVRKNLEFPLRMRRMKKKDIDTQVDRIGRMLELDGLFDRKPKQLSGGQRQRVAMGRALVRDPVAFLMDEPLSNLDAKLRVQMRAEISSLQRQTGTTTIYVTHDQVEAMTMGDRVAVMRLGVLQQCAPPQELYQEPANTFVAAFIGSPSMNLFKAGLVGEGDTRYLRVGEQMVAVAPETMQRLPSLQGHPGDGLIFGLRPEAFVPAETVDEAQRLSVTPSVVEPLGHEQMVHLDLDLQAVHISDAEPEGADAGTRLSAVARLPADAVWREGEAGTIGIDTRQLHVFDAEGSRLVE